MPGPGLSRAVSIAESVGVQAITFLRTGDRNPEAGLPSIPNARSARGRPDPV
jgi:hypothetical protein